MSVAPCWLSSTACGSTVGAGITEQITWGTVLDLRATFALAYVEGMDSILQFRAEGLPAQFDLGPYALTESLLWTADDGFFLMEYHVARLMNAAARCGIEVNPARVESVLAEGVQEACGTRLKVRLRVSAEGHYRFDANEIPVTPTVPARLRWSDRPVDSRSPYSFYKTTNRSVYERNLAAFPDADDVLLYNERGEVTETCLANIAIVRDGRYLTPPVRCGLLGGTFRASLLDQGKLEECVLTREDLDTAEKIMILNSVRKWRPGTLIRD